MYQYQGAKLVQGEWSAKRKFKKNGSITISVGETAIWKLNMNEH